MKARIKIKDQNVVAQCKKCDRFLSEIHGTTNTIVRCSSCKRDNSIVIVYSNL